MSEHDHQRSRDWYKDPCLGCTLGTPRNPRSYKGFNIHHLKRQNREGTTTASEVREVLSGVKPEDRDKITRSK